MPERPAATPPGGRGRLDAPTLVVGPLPTITLLGGDVHTAYVAEVTMGGRQASRNYQLVCSPFRHPLEQRERRVIRLLRTRAAARLTRLLARSAGVTAPAVGWQILSGPTFDNSIAVLALDERAAGATISRSGGDDEEGPALVPVQVRALSDPG